jgi:hypothetical protein
MERQRAAGWGFILNMTPTRLASLATLPLRGRDKVCAYGFC